MKNRVGEKYTLNSGYEVEIIQYFGKDNITIIYEDSTIQENVNFSNLKRGKVRKPENRLNKEFITNEGFIVKIVEYVNCHNCIVEYDDGIKHKVSYKDLREGKIKKPYNRIGEKHYICYGYEAEIIEYFDSYNCTIKINDELSTTLYNIHYGTLKRGSIKNPNHKSVFGVGYLGIGNYTSITNGNRSKYYSVWTSIIERCYNEGFRHKYPTYKDVTVCEEWHNFQNFAKWFEDNYNPNYMQGWHLDKDILVKGNKTYSPETCCFVPPEVNTLILSKSSCRGEHPIGVKKDKSNYSSTLNKKGVRSYIGMFKTPEEAFQAYKTEKEKYFKEVADKWKDLIDQRVYQALYNWKIEITD